MQECGIDTNYKCVNNVLDERMFPLPINGWSPATEMNGWYTSTKSCNLQESFAAMKLMSENKAVQLQSDLHIVDSQYLQDHICSHGKDHSTTKWYCRFLIQQRVNSCFLNPAYSATMSLCTSICVVWVDRITSDWIIGVEICYPGQLLSIETADQNMVMFGHPNIYTYMVSSEGHASTSLVEHFWQNISCQGK